MATTQIPTFGQTDDFEEFEGKERLPITLVGYDFVPHPTTGHREEYTLTIDVVPSLPSEKVIGAFARSEKRGQIDVPSLSKIVLSMVVPEDRERFLDFIENPDLAFTGAMFEGTIEYLMERAAEAANLPKSQLPDSSAGRKNRGGATSTGGRSGRAALPRSNSHSPT
jgi:hypothetical protein